MFGIKKDKHVVAKTVTLNNVDTPAVSLEKVTAAGSVSLTKQFQKTGFALSKRGLTGIRCEVLLVLDHSGSMINDYRSGVVQQLVERALAFGLNVDNDGEVQIIPFDSRVHPTVTVGLGSYQGVVDQRVWVPNAMGSTDMAAALLQVKKIADSSDSPVFCVVVTDGEPNSRDATSKVVCELASYPVFVKFLAIRPVTYLQELDDLDGSRRLLDNVDAKFIPNPMSMSDLDFADAMVDEFSEWITAAKQAGVLT